MFAGFWTGGTQQLRHSIHQMVHLQQHPSSAVPLSASQNPGCGNHSSVLKSSSPPPFYIPPNFSEFRRLAFSLTPVTDKVSAVTGNNGGHSYDSLYSKYFEGQGRRWQHLKILEIGLGCDMVYGPGASAQLWRKYLPNAVIWFAEFDSLCVEKYKQQLQTIDVQVVTGDQADNATLHSWVQLTGGKFDVIIDDGGHTNNQIYNSFQVLWYEALKGGGVYFIEDLQASRVPAYRGSGPVILDVIKDWIEALLNTVRFDYLVGLGKDKGIAQSLSTLYARYVAERKSSYVAKYNLPLGLKSIECAAEMCALVKCTSDDYLCPEGLALGAKLKM
eukprot:GHRR01026451.1.p1 GENE.GHRR01026451.1~~GHRR01026451.1.p1  ORF type:complete len:331 (+),score=43.90 GHRR01026451.1:939-1931(+)